jgi:hypothetical protein
MQASPHTHAALGFRVHSGWAALVILSGPLETPVIVDRRRIEIADPNIAGSKQPYHSAESLELKEAENFVAGCVERSSQLAKVAVQSAIVNAKQNGYQVSTAGVLIASGKPLPELQRILASHPLLHTAEGELFRNVIIAACRSSCLSMLVVKEKELTILHSQKLGVSDVVIQRQLARMGKIVGSPWRQDEKFASRVAWMALAAKTESAADRELSE